MTRDSLAEYLDTLARALVDAPDAVRITAEMRDGDTIYTVHVAPGDAGKVVGKDGRIANALRTLAKALWRKHKAKAGGLVFVEIDAPTIKTGKAGAKGGKQCRQDG